MFCKTLTCAIVITLVAQTNGCKLYCLECPTTINFTRYKYYCCMENWQHAPIVRNCGNNPTSIPPTTSATTPSTSTPCPTLQTPSRCPKPEVRSEKECEYYRRFYPNPMTCTSDKDCVSPFNACCEDGCFNLTRICKTYRDEFNP